MISIHTLSIVEYSNHIQKKNSEYFVINEELSEMFSSSGAGNVDLTGYNNKKFSTSFPAWRSKTPTGGYISFGITQEGQDENHSMIFDKVYVYCTENTHKDYLHSQTTNYNNLFKYAHGVDREDKKDCWVQFRFFESVDKNHRIDISNAVCSASGFWFKNGFHSIFGKSVTPDICEETGTDYRITSNGLFIIKDDKPIELLCDRGYGCTL